MIYGHILEVSPFLHPDVQFVFFCANLPIMKRSSSTGTWNPRGRQDSKELGSGAVAPGGGTRRRGLFRKFTASYPAWCSRRCCQELLTQGVLVHRGLCSIQSFV